MMSTTAVQPQNLAVQAAVHRMGEAVEMPLSIPALAALVGMSASHFSRCFKAELGASPGAFYTRRRVEAAGELLRTTDLSLTQIALRCGFNSSQYFATCYRRVTGCTPSAHRAQMRAHADCTARAS